MALNEPSDEQKAIVDNLNEYNIIVDSVAGSGKTTTVLHIAKKYINQSILLLTYNKKLRIDTKSKKEHLNLNNLEIHTYHSFYYKYYDNTCCEDQKIKKIIENKKQPHKIYDYDIIILDECQDMSMLYYDAVCKIFRDNNKHREVKLCILGDEFQSINEFNDADARFITKAEQLFNINNKSWKYIKLSTSFRLTEEISGFINNCLYKEERIKVLKKGEKVRYIMCDCFSDVDDRVYKEVRYYLSRGYSNEDIFILAPSVRSKKSPVRLLENKLASEGIKLFIPTSDEEKLDEDIMKGKIVFSSFHQVKGLERKVCIVFNFDESYFKYYKKDQNILFCPNEIYVAVTRASERLSLFHHKYNDYFPFMNTKNLNKYCECEITNISKGKINQSKKVIGVTDLLRHLSSNILEKAMSHITYNKIKNKTEKININVKIQQGELYESVGEITGTAIPAYYELLTTGKMTIYNTIISDINDDPNESSIINRIKKIKFKNNIITPEELLFISNVYCSMMSEFNHKINQIKQYSWLHRNDLNKIVEIMKRNIVGNAIYEKYYAVINDDELCGYKLSGSIDCIDENSVHEFKCSQELQNIHFLQLALYKYLFMISKPDINEYAAHKMISGGIAMADSLQDQYKSEYDNKKFLLTNLLTDETYEIIADMQNLKLLVKLLINNKFSNKMKNSDDEFIKKANLISSKYSDENVNFDGIGDSNENYKNYPQVKRCACKTIYDKINWSKIIEKIFCDEHLQLKNDEFNKLKSELEIKKKLYEQQSTRNLLNEILDDEKKMLDMLRDKDAYTECIDIHDKIKCYCCNVYIERYNLQKHITSKKHITQFDKVEKKVIDKKSKVIKIKKIKIDPEYVC